MGTCFYGRPFSGEDALGRLTCGLNEFDKLLFMMVSLYSGTFSLSLVPRSSCMLSLHVNVVQAYLMSQDLKEEVLSVFSMTTLAEDALCLS